MLFSFCLNLYCYIYVELNLKELQTYNLEVFDINSNGMSWRRKGHSIAFITKDLILWAFVAVAVWKTSAYQ